MRILVLGGTGIISTGLTLKLLGRGDQVTMLNRGRSANPFAGEVEIVIGSRQSAADLSALATRRFDAVIDMIGFTPQDTRLSIEAFAGKVPHFIYCSTVDVYTTPATIYPITEAHPREPSPHFTYAHNKAVSEELLYEAEKAGAFALTVLRPAATYVRGIVAPIGSTALYLDLLRRGRPLIMHGDGSTIWIATHRDDVAQAFVGALTNPAARGRSYNVASDEFITWGEYWRIAARAVGAPEPRFVHVPTDVLARLVPDLAAWCEMNFQYHNIIDSNAARRDLGFDPVIRWNEGAKALTELTAPPDPQMLERYETLLDRWNQAVGSMEVVE